MILPSAISRNAKTVGLSLSTSTSGSAIPFARNKAKLICRNSKTRGGAEVNIIWKNNDLAQI